ncbi:MAG TPA: hypothetical protein VFH39_05085, partial [Candidatus Saccharimonadales bacterium]|nr:hypothetical protein [Candidatus Saccharimonadales bacterium]
MAEPKTKSTTGAGNRSVKPKAADAPRRVKATRLDRWRHRKTLRPTVKKVPSAFKLTGQARRLLFKRWRLFGGIILVYLLLTLILV